MSTTRLLTIKVGNTNLGFGIFEQETLLRSWRAETRTDRTADEYAVLLHEYLESAALAPDTIGGAALVSVVPALTETMVEMCHKYLQLTPFIAEPGVKSGLRIKYDDPRGLGADRLVALVAARSKYGAPCLVIDLGTATTFNALDAQGDFIGGAIAPGLSMSAAALHEFTAKLPRIEIAAPERALGTNTRDALRSGIFLGYVGLVESLVVRLRNEMNAPHARVIATGGLANVLSPHCLVIEIVDADLALDGLRLLHNLNR
jgi:type III pantothenate kinase